MRYFGIVNPTQHTDEAPLLRSLSFFVSNEMAKRQMRQQQEFAIFHDLLTGLLNRNSYLRYLRDFSRAPLSSLGVAAANLNGLKAINQDYGHIQGNQTVIRHRRYFAEMLSAGAGVPFQWGRIYRIV